MVGYMLQQWLPYGFEKCTHFKSYKSHGEAIDADAEVAELEIPVLRALIQQYGEESVFNADEFGLNNLQDPAMTIGPDALKVRKLNEDRVNFLACSNTGSNEGLPLLVVGSAEVLSGQDGKYVHFD